MTDKQLYVLLSSILQNARSKHADLRTRENLNEKGTKAVWVGQEREPFSAGFPHLRAFDPNNWETVEDPDSPRVGEAIFGDFIDDLQQLVDTLEAK